jgi:hypothetical protein
LAGTWVDFLNIEITKEKGTPAANRILLNDINELSIDLEHSCSVPLRRWQSIFDGAAAEMVAATHDPAC